MENRTGIRNQEVATPASVPIMPGPHGLGPLPVSRPRLTPPTAPFGKPSSFTAENLVQRHIVLPADSRHIQVTMESTGMRATKKDNDTPTCFALRRDFYRTNGTDFSASTMGLAFASLDGRRLTPEATGLCDFIVLSIRRPNRPVGVLYRPNPGVRKRIEEALDFGEALRQRKRRSRRGSG